MGLQWVVQIMCDNESDAKELQRQFDEDGVIARAVQVAD